MRFNYWDLGQRARGDIVEVELSGNAANVRLLDSSNFSAYKGGRRHTAIGGHATRSPVRLQIPRSGHWYVAIDYGGLPGRGRASGQVLPGALPPLRERSLPSLESIGRNIAATHGDGDRQIGEPEWNVFDSRATEDKDEVVRPLANALQELGLRVWYDEFELRIGDSLRRLNA